MEILEQLHNILMSNLRESTNEPQDCSHKEFTSLIEVQASPLQRIQEFFELLFEHDDIRNFFLNHVGKNTDDKASPGSKKLSGLLTSKVAQMISSAPEDSLISEAAMYFKDKTFKMHLQCGNSQRRIQFFCHVSQLSQIILHRKKSQYVSDFYYIYP